MNPSPSSQLRQRIDLDAWKEDVWEEDAREWGGDCHF